MHIPYAPEVMGAIILTAVLSCLNSAFYVSSRVLFILAERGDAPQLMVRLNARKVPIISVLIGAVAGFLGIIAAAATEGSQKVFDFLVSASGAIAVFVYMAICFAQIALRRRRELAGEPVPAITMWMVPWLSYLTIAAMSAVAVAMVYTPAMQRDSRFSCVAMPVAVGAYPVVRRAR